MARPLDVTELLVRWSEGDTEVLTDLVPPVYGQLKRVTHARLRRDRSGHTINTTGLVHEAYLKLVDMDRVDGKSHKRFMAMASRVARHLLVDYAQQRLEQERAGNTEHVTLKEDRLLEPWLETEQFLILDEALERLEVAHPRQGRAAELHYFGGLSPAEVGQVLGISPSAAARDLRFARDWIAKGRPRNSMA
jgi:RNA polymerase sigma factor (TIGR02999 family)